MKTGGTVLPTELLIIQTVIIVPHSPQTAYPACFVPSRATVSGDCTTVDTPVSSMLHTPSAVNFQDLSETSWLSKNSIKFCFTERGRPEQTWIFGIPKSQVLVSIRNAL
jgi:hypothetical protein